MQAIGYWGVTAGNGAEYKPNGSSNRGGVVSIQWQFPVFRIHCTGHGHCQLTAQVNKKGEAANGRLPQFP